MDRDRIRRIYAGKGLLQAIRMTCSHVFQRYVQSQICTPLARLFLGLWGASVGKGLRVRGVLRLHIDGLLKIGSDVRVNSGPANYVGGDRRMSLWIGPEGSLTIGDSCALSNTTIVCMDSIDILPETYIGGGCDILDSDLHVMPAERGARKKAARGPIRIGPMAFIGANVTILKNVTIGQGAVVGAGSVVTRSIAPYEIWAGAPAKFIKKIDRSEPLTDLNESTASEL